VSFTYMNGTYRPLVFLYLADRSNLLAQDSKPELKARVLCSVQWQAMACPRAAP
jgi:hypothetical protein